MKTLILVLTFAFSMGGLTGYDAYNCRPCPVAAYNPCISQSCPFDGWSLQDLYTYSYYYYPNLASSARYLYYERGYSSSYVRWWLHGCMCDTWRNA